MRLLKSGITSDCGFVVFIIEGVLFRIDGGAICPGLGSVGVGGLLKGGDCDDIFVSLAIISAVISGGSFCGMTVRIVSANNAIIIR